MKDFSSIRLRRIYDGQLVPRFLLEPRPPKPVPDLMFKADNFYKFYGFYEQSPFSFLYIVMDSADLEEPRKGVVWMVADPIGACIIINFVSLVPELQGSGFYNDRIIPFIRGIGEGLNCEKIYWNTARPRAIQKLGGAVFEHGKCVLQGKYKIVPTYLMEYDIKENGHGIEKHAGAAANGDPSIDAESATASVDERPI